MHNKHHPRGARRGTALLAVTSAIGLVTACTWSSMASRAEAIVPPPTTLATPPVGPTLPAPTGPSPRPTRTPTTTTPPPTRVAPTSATTVASGATPSPPPPTTPPGDDVPAPPDQPPAQSAPAAPQALPDQVCLDDAIDDHYTATQGDTLVVTAPWSGVGTNDIVCGDNYDWTSFSDPPNGTVTAGPSQGGGFEYTPDPGFTGADSFTYTLVNNQVTVDQATAHINVTESCSMIGIVSYYTTPVATPLVVPAPGFLANDVLECPFDDLVVTSGSHGGSLIEIGDGGFEYSPQLSFLGLDTFSYELRDANQQVMASGAAFIYVSGPATCGA